MAPGRASRARARRGRQQGERHDRQVHEEDRAPVEVLDQEAAADRADGDAEPGHRGPDADRLRPLLGGEDVGEDREGGRHDQRAADAHERAARDQRVRACRPARRAASRRRRSPRPDDERPAAAEAVAEAAHREQQAGEDQRVGVDDPLELAGRGAESRSIVGSATLRIVLSSEMTSSETDRTTSVHHRRWYALPVVGAIGMSSLLSIRNGCVSIVKHIAAQLRNGCVSIFS